MSSDSDRHERWPAQRAALLDRHPRASWAARGSLDVAFWLEIHSRFRRECSALDRLADDYRLQRLPARELAIIATPRLDGLLTDLHGHHQIEDFHYFPAFRHLAPGLGPGIDVLEGDHADLASAGIAARNALRELRAASIGSDATTATLAADLFLAAADRLCRRILEHLRDEEDLVVPLLLEHEPAGAQPPGEP